ncbi:hypothetical protein LQZ18_07300 [Lachnospiraceae bacterium ZAX-1]
MKKITSLLLLLFTIAFSACQSNKEPSASGGKAEEEIANLAETTENETAEKGQGLYALTGNARSKTDYKIEKGKVILPLGEVSEITGSTCGTASHNIVLSKDEISELIQAIEDSPAIEELEHPFLSYGTLGIVNVYINGKDSVFVRLFFGEEDFVHCQVDDFGEGESLIFEINSKELTGNLRRYVDFRIIDRELLHKVTKATCTSEYNGETILLEAEDLKKLVACIQAGEKLSKPDKFGDIISVEFFMDDSTVIHGMFLGSYSTFGLEAEDYEIGEEAGKYFMDMFAKQGMPWFTGAQSEENKK